MRRLFLLLILSCFVCCLANARYVRKLREPEFFIPDQDKMHKAEKLPQIKARGQESGDDIPDYKTKYTKYLASINSEKTEEYQELIKDLSKMESGEIFEVVEQNPVDIVTQEQKDFYLLTEKSKND